MFITILIYSLLFLLVALVSGNNLSVCLGAIISGRMVSKRTGIIIAMCGYMIGFLTEGWLLRAGIVALLPMQSALLVALALGIALIIFIVSHLTRVPQSLSVTFAMILVGMGLGYGSTINGGYVLGMVSFWVFAIACALTLTMITMKSSGVITSRLKVWSVVRKIKLMLLALSFFSAFVLGANTIGFLYASTSGIVNQTYGIIVTLMAIAVGSVLLSGGELKRIGTEILPLRYVNALVSQSVTVILLEIATLFSIPASETWMFTTSLYGAGVSYKTRLIRKRPMLTIVSSWIGMSLIALLLGFVTTYVIYHIF